MKIKNKIKIYRAIKNITQEQLAEEVQVARKTINSIERGHIVPSTFLALKIARYFEITVDDIFSLEISNNNIDAANYEKSK